MLSNSKTIFYKVLSDLQKVYGEGEAKAIAYLLLEDLLGIDKTRIITDQEVLIPDGLNDQMRNALERLMKHEPIQYVLGKTHFYGREFQVNREVLIPRQETEELVDWILNEKYSPHKILDIGTGSGCIAISLALGWPESKVTAWDITETALKVATKNAKNNQAQVTFQKVDVLTDYPSESFDLIVSNPPYVLESEKVEMEKNVLAYEPEGALFVRDQDPLIFYNRIASISQKILKPGGWLYFEINEGYAKGVSALMKDIGFNQVQVRKDLNGKDRMIRGLLNS